MPTYDYRCERCSERFELWQSFSDDTLTTCPVEGGPAQCEAPGKGAVKKVFSKVGISFKGEGFYKTDHSGPRPGRSDRDESKSDNGSESSDSKAADSKSSDSKTSDKKSSDGAKSDGATKKTDTSKSKKKSDSKSAR